MRAHDAQLSQAPEQALATDCSHASQEIDLFPLLSSDAFETTTTRQKMLEELLKLYRLRESGADTFSSVLEQILGAEHRPLLCEQALTTPSFEAAFEERERSTTSCKTINSCKTTGGTVSHNTDVSQKFLNHDSSGNPPTSNGASQLINSATPAQYTHPDSQPITLLVLKLLYERYGFVPLSRPTSIQDRQQKQKDFGSCMKIILELSPSRNISAVFASSYAESIVDFITKTGKNDIVKPDENMWDVAAGKWTQIVGRNGDGKVKEERLSSVRGLTSFKFWVFDFRRRVGEAGAPPWLLGVYSPSSVLSACRWDPSLDYRGLAKELLRRGVQFRLVPKSNPHLQIAIPDDFYGMKTKVKASHVECKDFLFTRRDYEAYVNRRNAILADPRIQALALRDGGILWRLAGGWKDDNEEPQRLSSEKDIQFEDEPVMQYWSNNEALSKDEIDILCGVCYVYCSTEAEEYQEKSWWALPNVWRYHAKSWTELHEEAFMARKQGLEDDNVLRNAPTPGLDGIENGPNEYPQPLTKNEWTSSLRKFQTPWQGKVNKIRINQSHRSTNFLKSFTQKSWTSNGPVTIISAPHDMEK